MASGAVVPLRPSGDAYTDLIGRGIDTATALLTNEQQRAREAQQQQADLELARLRQQDNASNDQPRLELIGQQRGITTDQQQQQQQQPSGLAKLASNPWVVGGAVVVGGVVLWKALGGKRGRRR